MIKLFRHIRQRMLKENRITRYLVYALGEIILVVIGILIAVQINEYYNNKSDEKINSALLHRLTEEVNLNIERLDYIAYGNDKTFKRFAVSGNKNRLDTIIQRLNEGLDDEDIVYMNNNNFFNPSAYNLYSSVYEEIKNTGKLYSIGPDSLINKINVYYKLLERQEYYHKIQLEAVGKLKHECKYGWNKFRSDYFLDEKEALKKHFWLKDKSSKNYTDVLFYFLEARKVARRSLERMQGMKEASNGLINSIENELNT